MSDRTRSGLAIVIALTGVTLPIVLYAFGVIDSVFHPAINTSWEVSNLVGLVLASFVAPSTSKARGIAVGCFAVAASIPLIYPHLGVDYDPHVFGFMQVAYDVIGLGGWLTLRRRQPIAYLVLLPAAIVAALFGFYDYAPARWLAHVPYRVGFLNNDNYDGFTWSALATAAWTTVDIFAMALLALVAAIGGSRAGRSAGSAAPVGPYGDAFAIGYPPASYLSANYPPASYQPQSYPTPAYQPGYEVGYSVNNQLGQLPPTPYPPPDHPTTSGR